MYYAGLATRHSENLLQYNISHRYADQISNGDEVLVQGYKELAPTKVLNVTSFMMKGNHSS